MAKKLIVEIIGDASKLTRSFNQSTVAANKFGAEVSGSAGRAEKGLTKLQKVAAGGFIGGAAASAGIVQLRAAIGVASNLEEQLSRNNVVFGESADAVADWSKSTATSMGIAQDQALAAAGTFGAMFSQAGQGAQDAAVLSEAVVQLGSDLASFNNTTVDESLTALRSGLSGEIEPLRRFQVFLTEAAVSQRAMADSNKSTVQQLTQGEKIMARWNLILEQTGKQQGDFSRTSEGLANTQRRLSAQTRDLQANLGGLLLPAVTEVTGALADATGGALALADALRALGQVEIPGIDLPLNFTIPGTDTSAAGFWAKRLSPAGVVFNTADAIQFVGDMFGGGDKTTAPVNIPAKAFDDAFAPFTNQVIEGTAKAAAKIPKKVAAAFGQKGFKPSDANELGESLQRAFDSTLDALNLKFDRAVFAENTEGSLAILAEIEKAIRKRMETEGRTNELLRLLFEVEQQRAAIIADAAAKRKANADKIKQDRADAAAAIIGALEFGLTAAQLTPFLSDDLAAMRVLQAGLRKQIAAGKNVVENQRRLVVITDQIADTEKERTSNLRRAAHESAQRQQFRALGLTEEGETRLPGLRNIRKQFEQLSDNIIGQNVPKKLLNRLALVGKLLKGGIKSLEPGTVRAIQELFGEIRNAFDKESKEGPLTKTTSLNANQILKGLGLDPDTTRELRARLSSFNSAGVALAGGNRPTGQFRSAVPVVENHNTISIDGEVVGRSVTKSQQKRKRRNPTQKRGPNGGV